MNIEQYRALKAEEEAKAQQTVEQPKETPITEEPTKVKTPEVKEDKPIVEDKTPETIKIGEEELTIDELKNGYLRQSDYTKKTQEVSRQRKEAEEALSFYNNIKNNPEAIQSIKETIDVPDNLDPTQKRVIELETKMYEMMLEREIEQLQNKYSDFEVMEVLKLADEKKMTNLEDVYHILKSSKPQDNNIVDVDKLREELKEELLKELKQEDVSTNSIINSKANTAPVIKDKPQLSSVEAKVAGNMGMSAEEYIKWRDISSKK